MECAVIITDYKLVELSRNSWTLHYEEEELKLLGPWAQKTFVSIEEGGNGLFTDCINSTMTLEKFEVELLDFLKLHCPEKVITNFLFIYNK